MYVAVFSLIVSPNMAALLHTELTSSAISRGTASVLWDTTKGTSSVYQYVRPYFCTFYRADTPSKAASAIRGKITTKASISSWCSDPAELPLYLCQQQMDAVRKALSIKALPKRITVSRVTSKGLDYSTAELLKSPKLHGNFKVKAF